MKTRHGAVAAGLFVALAVITAYAALTAAEARTQYKAAEQRYFNIKKQYASDGAEALSQADNE